MKPKHTNTTAVAVFVKTPGVSPLKTRLAAGIGAEAAAEFYLLSIAAVEQQLAQIKKHIGIEPFWAIAEETELDNPLWQNHQRLWTGPGDLGERQSQVYDELRQNFSQVILIGADAPQLCEHQFSAVLSALNDNEFVFGPAHDGGYYLFAGRSNIARSVWQNVPWSTMSTRAVLQEKLAKRSAALKPLMDVDEAADLPVMQEELQKVPETMRVPGQTAILEWLKRYTNLHQEHKILHSVDD
ncbi:TIGR04282 family arsenosugar biosynthesis glycosyltransferase [Aliidiomarina shirensis]|uniref:TIGR04282 family arsenosugar biosynthesis glycosyltransferase n=1 Tax=Aliidiomarina shirensis TaxID=1048642 RepID=UPI00130072E3|nr:DUF2064 domain-containing protein [Aliidiomarina shirensis]